MVKFSAKSPGPTFKPVAVNRIETVLQRDWPISPQEILANGPPVFDGKRVYIRRDGETDGFDGVVTEVDGNWIYVEVADPAAEGFGGIWINTELQREIGVLK